MGSPMMKWRQVAACTLITLWLAGCSSDNSSAPISSVNGGGNGRMLSNGGNTSMAQSGDGGRIVYNRSYQNIPKGSYNGGTYTVKRGDTLFISLGSQEMTSAILQRKTTFLRRTASMLAKQSN